MALLSLALGASVRAEWALGRASDPESGDSIEAVIGDNERGFTLLLVRDPSGGARAIFRLPASDRDFLAATEPLRISFDGGPARQVPLAGSGLTWSAFPVWNGAGGALTGSLRELMQSKTLEITYFLNGGGYKEATFQLDGAGPILAETFAVPLEVSPEESRLAAELEAAVLAAAESCGAEKGKKRDRCIDALRACVPSSKTAAELSDCLEAKK